MSKVLSFTDRLEKKQYDQKNDELLKSFTENIFINLNHEQKLQLIQAIENKDLIAYKALTEPIIFRNVMKEINK